MFKKPGTFIFFGCSGSGKDTQENLLIKFLNENSGIKTISCTVGDKLRELSRKDTYTSQITKKTIESGELMPVFVPVWSWSSFLIENFTGNEHLTFNGISRRKIEAEILDGALKFYNRELVFVIFINVSKEWAMERLLSRGRKDDTKEGIGKRLNWFDENTMPAIKYFQEKEDYYFLDINGEQSIQEVHEEIKTKIKEKIDEK